MANGKGNAAAALAVVAAAAAAVLATAAVAGLGVAVAGAVGRVAGAASARAVAVAAVASTADTAGTGRRCDGAMGAGGGGGSGSSSAGGVDCRAASRAAIFSLATLGRRTSLSYDLSVSRFLLYASPPHSLQLSKRLRLPVFFERCWQRSLPPPGQYSQRRSFKPEHAGTHIGRAAGII